jgi:hypothetical protein
MKLAGCELEGRRFAAVVDGDAVLPLRELAGRFGASEVVDPTLDDPVAQVQGLTEGRGADYPLEGLNEALRASDEKRDLSGEIVPSAADRSA